MCLMVIFLFPLFFSSPPIALAATEVGGPIISDTTWTLADSPYIAVASVEVWEGVTLTIEPGVTVKFDPGYSLQVNGELIAKGTYSQPITFTSNLDSPAPDDWGHIEFTDTAIPTTTDAEGNYISGSILQYCVVEYGGATVYTSAIIAHSLLIDHCAVRYNDSRGIYDPGTAVLPSWIRNNTIIDNQALDDGGGIYCEYCTIENNTVIHNSSDRFGGGIYTENSTVRNNQVKNNSGGNGGGIYGLYVNITNNEVSDNSGSWGSGIYVWSDSVVSDNIVSGNTGTYGINAGDGSNISGNRVSDNEGGIHAMASIIANNTVVDNTAAEDGGGIYAYEGSEVNNNVVIGNSVGIGRDGGGIFAEDSILAGNIVSLNSAGIYFGNGGGIYAYNSSVLTNTITHNIVNGTGQGAGMYFMSGSTAKYITGNTIIGNTVEESESSTDGGLAIYSYYGLAQVHENTFYGNYPYDVVILSSSDISGTNNYWGTVESVDILEQVYDWYDDSSRGKFLFVPYLQEPSPEAPFPPPLGLSAQFDQLSVTLTWEALPGFETGWGYKVYYDSDEPLPPFEGADLVEGSSPIDSGSLTASTLSGLDPLKDYYFTVTAYDTQGHESWYAGLIHKIGGYWRFLPMISK
jgi:predicted outer membrane repeat protein/parallel beta-helix repeat protein